MHVQIEIESFLATSLFNEVGLNHEYTAEEEYKNKIVNVSIRDN